MHIALFLLLAARDTRIEDPRALADKYLVALTDNHDQSGKDHLLGGLTLDAVTASTNQPEIVGQGPKRSEDGTIADALKAIAAVDSVGQPGGLTQVTFAEAKKLQDKTKAERKELSKKFPVLADTIRADRPLYWHPKNPARLMLLLAAKDATYHLDYVAFTVKSKGSDGKNQTWPLRVVRFKSGDTDTGWKVIPASSWDPE